MKNKMMQLGILALSSMLLVCAHGCGTGTENEAAQKDSNLRAHWYGIWAETDTDSFTTDAEGSSTLNNETMFTAYLPGCAAFNYEKLVNGRWIEEGPNIICIWEGIGRPVKPYQSVTTEFMLRDIGTWRLYYTLSFGCTEGKPLSQADCMFSRKYYTNEFTVTSQLVDDCLDSGGTIDFGSCCLTTKDLANTCQTGACSCSSENSHDVHVCNCPEGQCFDGHKCVVAISQSELNCTDSGGTVDTANCCLSTYDFPNNCRTGACGCSSAHSHEVQVCNCPDGQCFDGYKCVFVTS